MTRRSEKLAPRSVRSLCRDPSGRRAKIGLTRQHVRVFSRRGEIELGVRVTKRIKPGIVFIPFHFAEAAANALTNAAIDPVAKIPEYKVCAVRVEAV